MFYFRKVLVRIDPCLIIWMVMLLAICNDVSGEKCYRDEELGDREGNVYHCESKDLPRCCEKDNEATCCVSESEKNLEEQLQLWGTVAAIIVLIAILFVCCKNDVSFCNDERPLTERWRNFRNKNKNKSTHLVEEKEHGYYDNPIGVGNPVAGFNRHTGEGPTVDPYRYPPPSLPPFGTAMSEKVKNCNQYSAYEGKA